MFYINYLANERFFLLNFGGFFCIYLLFLFSIPSFIYIVYFRDEILAVVCLIQPRCSLLTSQLVDNFDIQKYHWYGHDMIFKKILIACLFFSTFAYHDHAHFSILFKVYSANLRAHGDEKGHMVMKDNKLGPASGSRNERPRGEGSCPIQNRALFINSHFKRILILIFTLLAKSLSLRS